jgi:2-C-methyl-D-erythritol 4-phosphate cytidylyltransferase
MIEDDLYTSVTEIAAIVVGGGSGARFGSDVPKQFLPLPWSTAWSDAGVSNPLVIHWAVRAFLAHPLVTEVVVVVPEAFVKSTREALAPWSERKYLKVCAGGERRQDSVMAGLNAAAGADIVLIHDAARPFPPDNITASIRAAQVHGAAIHAIPSVETVKRVSETRQIIETVPRDELALAQTPQVFRRSLLVECLATVTRRGLAITDDASALELCKKAVHIVPGSSHNLKITRPEDLHLAQLIAAGKSADEEPKLP